MSDDFAPEAPVKAPNPPVEVERFSIWLQNYINTHLEIRENIGADRPYPAEAALRLARMQVPPSGRQTAYEVDQIFAAGTELPFSSIMNALELFSERLVRRHNRATGSAVVGSIAGLSGLALLLAAGQSGLRAVSLQLIVTGIIVFLAGLMVTHSAARSLPADGQLRSRPFPLPLAALILQAVLSLLGAVGAIAIAPDDATPSQGLVPAVALASLALLTALAATSDSRRSGNDGVPGADSDLVPWTPALVSPDAPLAALRYELLRLRDTATRAGLEKQKSAIRWRATYIAIGIPSAALAAAAGVTGLDGEARWWTVALGLAAAGLTAAATALNPGRNWEVTSQAADKCRSLAREIEVMHNIDVDTYGEDRRAALEAMLNRLDMILDTTDQDSFWSKWKESRQS